MADQVRVSKFLARHLRHQPERIGLTLQSGGWVRVDDLLRACAQHNFPLTREQLDTAVYAPGKRRYSYDDSGSRVRAVQGHSVPVDLGYKATTPPDVLFHGTHPGVIDIIKQQGLQPMSRQHVHLSMDIETAMTVGARRGKPTILHIDARRMHDAAHSFFQADNGVWLTEQVPTKYILWKNTVWS